MILLQLDFPVAGEKIASGQLFRGWSVSEDPAQTVSATVNGRPIACQVQPRTDVEALLPGKNAKGFYFCLETLPGETKVTVVLQMDIVAREFVYPLA